ncbi:hypothetical protein B0H65DRAFT_442088 [Neurospora tetraspora]|uniref:Uncharacterized protein n=1 Tax=Neurospora tetraspora TaxID=94610 RepID=A0AAE0MRU3_9PEZI|nr:hypothetical protein B0H65DRAFT_442088 [Neurospora tetraspora]
MSSGLDVEQSTRTGIRSARVTADEATNLFPTQTAQPPPCHLLRRHRQPRPPRNLIDIENKYYNAKQTKTSDPEEALQEFLSIPPLEQEKGDWGFKALKQAIKLEFKLERY